MSSFNRFYLSIVKPFECMKHAKQIQKCLYTQISYSTTKMQHLTLTNPGHLILIEKPWWDLMSKK